VWGTRVHTAAAHSQIFAANRASGRIALKVAASGGETRRVRVQEDGALRVRFPNVADRSLEAVIVNTGGGIAGGDRFSIELDAAAGACLLAGTAAAEKVYRSAGADAEMRVSLTVADGARLAWLPQETILFNRARLSRHISLDLAESASLIAAEAVVFGRTAMGEAMQHGCWRDQWRLRRGGRLVFAENVRLDGAIAEKLQARVVAAGAIALATMIIVPASDEVLAAVRALNFRSEAGISAWQGIAVARLIAADALALRRDLAAMLAVLGNPVPQLWLH